MPLLVGAIAALLVLVVLILTRPSDSTTTPPPPVQQPTTASWPTSAASDAPSSEPPPSSSLDETSATPESSAPWSPFDPPTRADAQDDETEVVENTGGEPCASSDATAYGRYPAASCDLWKTPTGLLYHEQIDTGPRRVACQRDLGEDNPKYTRNQTNTWWIWTTSESGTWDWYPETAIKEGASDEPVSGVALCHR